MRLFRRIKQQIIASQCEPVLQDIRNLRLNIQFENEDQEKEYRENLKKLYQSVIDAKKDKEA